MRLARAVWAGEHDFTLTIPAIQLVGYLLENVAEGVRGVRRSEQPIRIRFELIVTVCDLVCLKNPLESALEDFTARDQKIGNDSHNKIRCTMLLDTCT